LLDARARSLEGLTTLVRRFVLQTPWWSAKPLKRELANVPGKSPSGDHLAALCERVAAAPSAMAS
jgi:hypothetical protein